MEDRPPTGPAPAVADRRADEPRPARRWWRLPLLAVGIVVAVVELREQLPDPAAIWTALRHASPAWLAVALALEVVSMVAFAEQQRYLLASFGVRMRAPVALAVSYARAAMATALPGGSAISAGYAFRQSRAHGASQPVAAAVTVLAGVTSLAGLSLIYAGDLVAWALPAGGPLAALAIVAVFLALVFLMVRATRSRPDRVASTDERPAAATSTLQRLGHTLRQTLVLARTVPAHRWLGVVAIAVFNWHTDLACLLAAVHAVGLGVSTRGVATAYLAAQLVRQIPATPGGIGVIEASLVVALTSAGAGRAPAAAAVLIYRLLTCWGVLPVGLTCWMARRAATRADRVATTASGWPLFGRAMSWLSRNSFMVRFLPYLRRSHRYVKYAAGPNQVCAGTTVPVRASM